MWLTMYGKNSAVLHGVKAGTHIYQNLTGHRHSAHVLSSCRCSERALCISVSLR